MSGLLERVAECEQPSFGELTAKKFDAHRENLKCKSRRHRERWKRQQRGQAAVVRNYSVRPT